MDQIWYNFALFLSLHFKELSELIKFHYFWFSKLELDKVYYSKKSGNKEIPFILLNNNSFNFNQIPFILEIQSLILKCQWYLYNKIHQYIDKKFKDNLCPFSISNNDNN